MNGNLAQSHSEQPVESLGSSSRTFASKCQSTRRRPEVRIFTWKTARCIACMGVNDMHDL